jgi:hypothetical protein
MVNSECKHLSFKFSLFNFQLTFVSFFLNICSIRSVTKKPPTTLIVARIMAIEPRIVIKLSSGFPATNNAPITAIPEIALEPDINGVCRVGGTLLITSAPASVANKKTNKAAISVEFMTVSKLEFLVNLETFLINRRGAEGAEQERRDSFIKQQLVSLSILCALCASAV